MGIDAIMVFLGTVIIAAGGAGIASGRGAAATIRGVLTVCWGALVWAVTLAGTPGRLQAAGAVVVLVVLALMLLAASVQVAAGQSDKTDVSGRRRLKG